MAERPETTGSRQYAASGLPRLKATRRADPDYRALRQQPHLQRATAESAQRVQLATKPADDWGGTGSQAAAVRSMVEECDGHWAGCAVIVDQTTPALRADLGVRSILTAAELPTWDRQFAQASARR